jgi:Fe-Mn family superoxide dismutase
VVPASDEKEKASMIHRLPDLPYALRALEPHMSKKTLELHHGKHHAAYVAKLNKLIKGTEFAEQPLEDVVTHASGAIFDNAAQCWNHTFFWFGLSPEKGSRPSPELHHALIARFDSLPNFRKQFSEAAINTFGSGWAWLIRDSSGKLDILSTRNAANPLTDAKLPLLTCDVWEHAYYVDYQNRRPDYLAAFWKLVDWERVSDRFAAAALDPKK